ncbi:Na/Pi cotransporter family protein [Aliidongia dinghuensis]|nr:Na/Pi cotransporter family protein [Aliidongia dinghuensis]
MSATWTLLDLAGDVVLLLWGMHMVHNGIMRAYGADLRRVLGRMLGNRVRAMLAGAGLTVLLQSSTATSLMAASFAGQGALDLVPGLAIMLGANLGTTLVVQILSFDVSKVVPLFLIAGFAAFKHGTKRGGRDLGRIGLGLGMMLLALHLLGIALEPAAAAPALRELLASLTGDPVLDLVLAAVLTWATHSSVAVVLLVSQLAMSGTLPPAASLAFVLGANLGSTVPALLSAGQDRVAQRLPLGNMLIRLAGCILALPFLSTLARLLGTLAADPARLVADFHTAFNLLLAIASVFFLDPLGRLLTRLLPAKAKASDPAMPLFLDYAALDTPHLALANATREVLRVAETVETMLRAAQDALLAPNSAGAAKLSGMGKTVDRLLEAVKAYVAHIGEDAMNEDDARRRFKMLAFIVSLGHATDVVERGLATSGFRKLRGDIVLPPVEAEAVTSLFGLLLDNLRLALSTLISGDERGARALLDAKRRFNEREHALATQHLASLRNSNPASGLDASALYLAVLRDLKQIDSHLAAVAYPLPEAESRQSATESTEACP